MNDFLTFFKDLELPGYAALCMGAYGIVLIVDRVKYLYFDCAIRGSEFMSNLHSLVMADKMEEAIALCEANKKAPLAQVMKAGLERADRDEAAINQAIDVKLSDVGPLIGGKIGYLQMIANVATLMGLLGTIHGLIMSFKAVSFADPAQKQTLLAQGISVSMNTTMIGLAIAIPVMIAYSFLHGRQTKVMEEISGACVRLTDWLTSRDFEAFHADRVYPSGRQVLKQDMKVTPSAKQKVG